jgi:hypothetical protein
MSPSGVSSENVCTANESSNTKCTSFWLNQCLWNFQRHLCETELIISLKLRQLSDSWDGDYLKFEESSIMLSVWQNFSMIILIVVKCNIYTSPRYRSRIISMVKLMGVKAHAVHFQLFPRLFSPPFLPADSLLRKLEICRQRNYSLDFGIFIPYIMIQ